MSKSWSIHTRPQIVSKYEIQGRIGAGAYADVYKARRLSDSLLVALKEIHDYQSAFREIEALQSLQNCPNVVVMHEFFWSQDEDTVLVLEYLPTDLGSVIREGKKWSGGLTAGEIKRWVVQILSGIDSCHRNSIVHRDLKPSNLLISAAGVLKLADFGQARILLEPRFVDVDDNSLPYGENTPNQPSIIQSHVTLSESENARKEVQDDASLEKKECGQESREFGSKSTSDGIDKESNFTDGNTSCLATCTTSDMGEDPLKSSFSFDAEEGANEGYDPLTSCVGTRWFRSPELLYGCTKYGPEVDLWSLGCIFAELFTLEPLFPGASDIDQLGKIFSVLGNLTEEIWPGCLDLPDYKIISFEKVENPSGLEACLVNCSADEVLFVKKLLCFDPASRATSMELLHDKYLNEEPLPLPISELRVPAKHSTSEESSASEWGDYCGINSDSDDDFGPSNVTNTSAGFVLQFT